MTESPSKNVLVLVDGNESAVKAAAFAIKMAGVYGVKLAAISVVDTDTLRHLMSVRILVEQEVRDFEAELERNQRRYLDFVQREAQKANVEIELLLKRGICHIEVLAEQRRRNADLIIIGGFRSTLTRLDLVVRERQIILDEAPCPVLVVK
jgi:nucleotide-binding universal stress UspA family protein